MNRKLKSVLKRTCSFIMAMVMLFTVSMTALARSFEDVTYYSRKYQDAISYVADNQYMVGVDEDSFLPEGKLTRGMIVTLLYSMAGKPQCTNTIPFTDVTASDWFYNGVRWAYANGIVSGKSADKFAPNDYVKKQDATLILYKYAIYNGMDVSDTCSLSDYTDASNVDSYALTAVKWAVERDVFPVASSTTLEPQASLTRAQMALMITEYGLNVEHIVYGRDNYSFNNSDDYFDEGVHIVLPEHAEKLYACIDAAFVNYPELAELYKDKIRLNIGWFWFGSCYGMATTTILDKMGKIDFNGNFAENAKTMHDVELDDETESVINYYHFAQYLPYFGLEPEAESVSEEMLERLVNRCKEEKGLKLFCYRFKSGTRTSGHAIVAYDLEQNSNGDYVIKAYDNRYKDNAPISIIIEKDYSSCKVYTKSKVEEVTGVRMFTDMSLFDVIDIDDELNVGPIYSASEIEMDDVTLLEMELTSGFVITNAEGEKLIWDNVELSGDMKVISSNLICCGPDLPARLVVCVETSDSYVYQQEEMVNTNIAISNQIGYSAVSGINVESIRIDDENRMSLSGTNMEYEILYNDSVTNEIEIVSSNGEK